MVFMVDCVLCCHIVSWTIDMGIYTRASGTRFGYPCRFSRRDKRNAIRCVIDCLNVYEVDRMFVLALRSPITLSQGGRNGDLDELRLM